MIRFMTIVRVPTAMAVAVAALPRLAHACAVCAGGAGEPLAKGMGMGILTLLLIVAVVLGGISAFFLYLRRRLATLERNAEGPLPAQLTGIDR